MRIRLTTAISFVVASSAISVQAQLFGGSKKGQSQRSQYEVKSPVGQRRAAQPQRTYDGMTPIEEETEPSTAKKAVSSFADIFKRKSDKPTVETDMTPADSTSMATAVMDPYCGKFVYNGFALNGIVNMETIVDSVPPAGFMSYVSDMQLYVPGEDLRLLDKYGNTVTLMFDADTTRLTTIQVEDIESMAYVQQLQALVNKQLGEPTQGYEVIRNYDGDNNSVWTDYSTYEFMYRYRVGGYSYDFNISQYGAKKYKGKVIHPYDFKATVNKHALAAPSPNQQIEVNKKRNQNSEKDEVMVIESVTPGASDFYPQEGTQRYGDYTVEVKMLKKW